MTVREVYKKFGVPENLAEHMMRVAGVVEFLRTNWSEREELDWNLLIKIALLHDLGNVVKFTDIKSEELKKLQADTVAKYGSDDHEATKSMLTELGVEEIVKQTILSKSFGNSVQTANSDNWYPKILHYADLRVMPHGICTLEERIEDVRVRYPKYTSRSDFPDLVAACFDIEKQIQENIRVSVSEISSESIKIDDKLLKLTI